MFFLMDTCFFLKKFLMFDTGLTEFSLIKKKEKKEYDLHIYKNMDINITPASQE